jgi:hypothetical protein
MSLVLAILAVAGFLAVVYAGVRAALRVMRGGLETFIAREVASARATRGDLSGLTEAKELQAHTRRARRLAAFQVLAWGALLVVPAFTPWTRELYAAYAVLWLVPRGRGAPAATS